jgi:pyridoxamine 5'-phosphate oxidase-like protein
MEGGAMPNLSPVTFLDARYSQENAQPTPWPDAVAQLERAGLFWVSSVRTNGRPHVTPVVAVWMDGALYFSSGPGEQKSKNLAASRHCAVTTGCNTWNQGLDIVLHGQAVIVRDLPLLQQVADTFVAKYGDDWAFEVAGDGTFRGHGVSLVYQLIPVQALGFRKDPFSHTRWDFTT